MSLSELRTNILKIMAADYETQEQRKDAVVSALRYGSVGLSPQELDDLSSFILFGVSDVSVSKQIEVRRYKETMQ